MFLMWVGLAVETQHYLWSSLLHHSEIKETYYGQVQSYTDMMNIWLILHGLDQSSDLS